MLKWTQFSYGPCQEEEFFDEIRCLMENRCLTNRKSTIYKCSPYLDPVGVLRMQGRIDVIENVEASVKRPVILSRHHKIAYLIVEYHYRKYHHLHAEIVVNEIRQKYWIPGLRALVKEIINNCPVCCIRQAQPIPPMMGTLPKERLSPHTLPFTHAHRVLRRRVANISSFWSLQIGFNT